VKQIRKRLTYANVISSVAVFLVLGGAAFAAVKLPKNSVGTKQLKNNAVTTAKIKDGAVTASKVNVSGFPKVPSAASADTATNAGHAASADKATTATSADKATNANLAADSNALGGKAASEYSIRYFARVSSGATPTLVAGSPGVSVNASRPFTGAATVVFPVDMTNCAIIVTPFSGGGTVLAARQSSISSGKNVAIVIENTSGTGLNEAFNIIGVC
jgi:hypothetical protein